MFIDVVANVLNKFDLRCGRRIWFTAAAGAIARKLSAGGIGENAPVIRARICDGLNFLGIEIDDKRNAASDPLISTDLSRTQVRVIRTDEEVIIAKAAFKSLADSQTIQHSNHRE